MALVLSNKPVIVITGLADAQFQALLAHLISIERKIDQYMPPLDDQISALQAEVAKQSTVDQSAVTLIQGLSSQLAAALTAAQNAGATPTQLAALSALQTQLSANDTGLAAAVTANTPIPPTPPAPPA